MEKHIYSRLYSFLTAKHILNGYQFGFKRNHWTCLALINEIYHNVDDHDNVLGIYLDLHKAFDTMIFYCSKCIILV